MRLQRSHSPRGHTRGHDLNTRCGAASKTTVPATRTRPQGATAPAVPSAEPQRAQGSRRRRLWELPAEAYDVLLAMGLPPDTLRRLSEQALGRLHRARCRVGGSDTDLLYGVLHDLGHRNPLSDTLHDAQRDARLEAARRGAVARLQQQLSQSTGAPLVAPRREPAARAEPRPAPQRTAQAVPAAPHHPAAGSAVRRGAALRTPVLRPGYRVLCLGGMPRAKAQYRALVERLVERAGARFAYYDGGVEDGAQRLQQLLGAADLVVCQAGCLNHAVYRTIKGQCKRLDKPCLYLERPSLSRFARCLDAVRAAPLSDDVAGVPA